MIYHIKSRLFNRIPNSRRVSSNNQSNAFHFVGVFALIHNFFPTNFASMIHKKTNEKKHLDYDYGVFYLSEE